MPSIGLDLAAVRKEKNMSLEEIQSLTKIPLSTLKQLEDGSLFENTPDQYKTYIRSFVRSYGKALKIDDDVLVASLDAYEVGIYKNEILLDQEMKPKTYPLFELDDKKSPTIETDALANKDSESVGETVKHQSVPSTKASETTPAHVASPKPPTVDSIDWVGMGKKFSDPEVKSRIWILASAFILIIIIAGAIFVFRAEIFGIETDKKGESEEITYNEADNTEESNDDIPEMIVDPVQPPINEDNSVQQQAEESIYPSVDSDTLEILVYAAFDKLEPVRVTSDLSSQTNPYWIEQGEAFRFQFRDTLLVRGQYSRMLLLFNGHIVENFRQQYFNPTFNSVMITRNIFKNDPTFRMPAPDEFPSDEGAPTSIINASDLR